MRNSREEFCFSLRQIFLGHALGRKLNPKAVKLPWRKVVTGAGNARGRGNALFQAALGQDMISSRKQFPGSSLTKLLLSGFQQTALGFLATACRNRSTATLQQLHVCRIVGKLDITPSFHFLLCARERLVYKDLVSLKIYLKSLLFLFLINLLGFGL